MFNYQTDSITHKIQLACTREKSYGLIIFNLPPVLAYDYYATSINMPAQYKPHGIISNYTLSACL